MKFKLTEQQKTKFTFDYLKVVVISDTHGRHLKVELPEGDLLLVCGDITMRGEYQEIAVFADWLKIQEEKYKKVVVIAGNHDWAFQTQRLLAKDILLKDLTKTVYLEDEFTEFQGLKIYGSPITPEFCGWAFMKERGPEIAKYWDAIPKDTDILLTHGPAAGILDFVHYDQINVGCQDLLDKMLQIPGLLIHGFGHIHETHGIAETKWLAVNGSVVTLQYRPENQVIALDLFKTDDYLEIVTP